MYKGAATFIGVLIAMMVMANGVLAGHIGSLATLPVIHISGLITVSLVLLIAKERKSGERVPFYLNTGGLIGVLLVLVNNRCFESLGASMTLSLGIIGQTLGSLAADSTGFLGMKKYPFDRRKSIGLILLFAGAALMTDSWSGDFPDILLALLAGTMVILSMIINSRLSLKIGTFRGVRRNYLAGLFGSLIVLFLFRESLISIPRNLISVNPLYIVGGGFLGVMIVAGSNRVLPKIPVVYTTLLLFGGQVIAGIFFDYAVSGVFSLNKIGGVALILSGLFVNMLLEKRGAAIAELA